MRKINPNSLKNLTPGGPGRPKGSKSGRTLVLQTLDKILAEQKTQEKIREFYQAKIDENLDQFLRDHVYPFIPKEAKLNLFGDDENNWKITIEKIDINNNSNN
ncbi:MAG: hypothetical protein ACFFDN_05205 [Candidatus Hodarchaeota archaeon]